MIIIPAIDIIAGECVRLSQGDYAAKTTYYKDPLDAAKMYADYGFTRLHLVDLDGAKESRPANLRVLERIVAHTPLVVQYGGGIKSHDSLSAVFESGAGRAICGSVAVTQPSEFREWLSEFTPERIILGADTKDGLIAINGWKEAAKMGVDELIDSFATLSQVICTDISRDGMLAGPSFDLYERLQNKYTDIDITVSGGISCAGDIERLIRQGARSVVVGKAIYEGKVTLKELMGFNY